MSIGDVCVYVGETRSVYCFDKWPQEEVLESGTKVIISKIIKAIHPKDNIICIYTSNGREVGGYASELTLEPV